LISTLRILLLRLNNLAVVSLNRDTLNSIIKWHIKCTALVLFWNIYIVPCLVTCIDYLFGYLGKACRSLPFYVLPQQISGSYRFDTA
jgi:hypothetical protein